MVPIKHQTWPFANLDALIICSCSSLLGRGFVCKCPACINASPKADQLRKTVETEIDRLCTAMQDPSAIDQTLLEDALMLEKDMVRGGLDAQFNFGSLLTVIGLVYARLGKRKESDVYRVRVEEFSHCEE